MTTQAVSPIEAAQGLAEAISRARTVRLKSEADKPPWKPRRHYASSLNGCARQLVYAQTHWQEKEKFPPEAIAAMEDGRHEERLLIQELLADAFDVVEQQVQLDDDRYWITGKIDGKVKWAGRRVPFEAKRLKPFMFEKIETVDDLKGNPFLMKYLRQLTLYLYLHNEEAGLFILSDGVGCRKEIVVQMDYALAESILKDLDTANASLKAIQKVMDELDPLYETTEPLMPPRIPYSSKVCGYCPFRRVCLPDMDFGQGAVMGETELAQAVKRFQEIKPLVSESDRLKREIKKAVEGKEMVLCGDFMVTGKWMERKVKAQAERADRFWKWEIEPMTQPAGDPPEAA